MKISHLACLAALMAFAECASANCDLTAFPTNQSLSGDELGRVRTFYQSYCKEVSDQLIYAQDAALKGRIVLPKEMIESPFHAYPLIAEQMGIDGTTWLAFVVEADGRIKKLAVIRSAGLELLDRAAVNYFSSSMFLKPGTLDGKATPILIFMGLKFKMYNWEKIGF